MRSFLHDASRRPLSTTIIILAVASAAMWGVNGCGQAEKQSAPHASGGVVDRSAPDFVIAMPEDYRNVVAKCDGHGHRVYVTSHGTDQPSALAVIADRACGAEGTP